MKKKKILKSLSSALPKIIFVLLGGLLGILIGKFFKTDSGADVSGEAAFAKLILWLASIYAGCFLQIIIHEAGHLVFGLITGYRFSSFRIGSFMWLNEDSKIKLRRYSLAGTGGQCLMSPPEIADEKMPFVLYNLGGSAMNMITALIFLGAYFLCKNIPYLSLFFLIISLIGFASALLNGIPMPTGIVVNDGSNTKMLLKNKSAVRSFRIQLNMVEQLSKGVRIKYMPADWFTMPAPEDMNNYMTSTVAVLVENRLMDEHRFDEAAELIESLIPEGVNITELHRRILICDRLYCELIGNKNGGVIEKLRSKKQLQFIKQMQSNLSVIRTEYAFALLWEKDEKKADTLKKSFEKHARKYPYPCDAESDRELIQIADETAENTLLKDSHNTEETTNEGQKA